MDASKIALVIWVNDDPMQGSIIRLEEIAEPRKPVAEYAEGDKVVARCRSFKGLHSCILARIRDSANRDELRKDLSTNFCSLLQEFHLLPSSSNPGANAEDPTPKQPDEIPSTGERKKRGAAADSEQKKKKAKKATNLIQISEELSLTEMTQVKSPVKIKPVESPVESPVKVESPVLSPVKSAFKKVTPTKGKGISSIVGDGLLTLVPQNQSTPVKSESQTQCQCQETLASLQSELQRQQEQLQQPAQPAQPAQSAQQNEAQQPAQVQQQQSFISLLNEEEPRQASLTDNNSATESAVAVHGGFTKEQLLAFIEKVQDHSKASKKLFRKLYRPEEYIGRTLTGAKPNTVYGSRPPLEDPSKLRIIYEIMKEKYGVGEVTVRDKIRELLKPSRSKLPQH